MLFFFFILSKHFVDVLSSWKKVFWVPHFTQHCGTNVTVPLPHTEYFYCTCIVLNILFVFVIHLTSTHVPTLPCWTGGSCFHWAAPVFPFISEISHFEMILAWILDIYESSKSITLSINSMWKAWLLLAKLGACIALGHHLHHDQ